MRLIDADALIDGYKHMGYDPSEHPEESYMEGWCKGFNSAVDHCVHHAIHAHTIEPEPMDVQEAYLKGKIDGIKECTARLRLLTAEFKDRKINRGEADE